MALVLDTGALMAVERGNRITSDPKDLALLAEAAGKRLTITAVST